MKPYRSFPFSRYFYLIIVLSLGISVCLFSCKKDKQAAPIPSQFSVSFTELDNINYNQYSLKAAVTVQVESGDVEYGFLMGTDTSLSVTNTPKIIVGKTTTSVSYTLTEKALDTGLVYYFRAYALQGSNIAYSPAKSIAKVSPAINSADSIINYGYNIGVYTNMKNLDPNAQIMIYLNNVPQTFIKTTDNYNQACYLLSYPTQLPPGDYTLTLTVNSITITFRKKITLLSGRWQKLTDIPFAYPWLAVKSVEGFISNGSIYQYGWIRSSTTTVAQFYRYNYQTGQQQILTGFDPAGRNILLENPEITINGDIHFLGGETIVPDFYSVNTHCVYHTQTDSWTQEPNIPGAPRQDAVGFLYNNKIYFGLGYQSSNFNSEPFVYQQYYKDFYSYDPQSENWEKLADYPLAGTYYSTSFMIGSKIYITGGVSTDGNGTSVKDTWCYDIPSNTWTKKTSFPGTADLYYYSFTIGNYAYVGGGQTASYDSYVGPNYLVQCYRYDPTQDKWAEVSNVGVSMFCPTSGTVNQTGIVAGGMAVSWQPLTGVYQFTP